MKKSDRDIIESSKPATRPAARIPPRSWPVSIRKPFGATSPPVTRGADAGRPPIRRPRIIDDYLPKIEKCVDRSKGKVRANVVHERLVELGFDGTERTTRGGRGGGEDGMAGGASPPPPTVPGSPYLT